MFTQSHFEKAESFDSLSQAAMEYALSASGLPVKLGLVRDIFVETIGHLRD